MRNLKKTMLVIAATCILLGATPAFAQLLGAWEGDGLGSCVPHPGMTIYPWSVWTGEVFESPDEDIVLFEGKWEDELGYHGIFKGRMLPFGTPTQSFFRGQWFWYDPTINTTEPVFGGKFNMTFTITETDPPTCNGTWTTIWPSPGIVGTMEGYKVD
jgi:hypothetical protein